VIRTGVITNPMSRRNRQGPSRQAAPGVVTAAPADLPALDVALARFAAEGLDLLVIDGGDGAVREVLTRAPSRFGQALPPIAILPSGKTNALALDLGARPGWSLEQAIAGFEAGRLTRRAPLEVTRAGAAEPCLRGFIFGAGAYVQGIELAQKAHRAGAFDSIAVGVTLAVAAVRTATGGPTSSWRPGVPMRLGPPGASDRRQVFLLLAASLKRFPLRMKPFGPPSADLRTLVVDAPPRRLLRALPPLLMGAEPAWLETAGYRRRTVDSLDLSLESRFVLDGETYPGGELHVARGPELAFVKP
jgi:hypothetical protein